MTIPENPPRGLRWTATPFGKGLTTLVSLVALIAAVLIGVRQQLYISCVGANQAADARRTAAIAAATDAERTADRNLIAGPVPGGPSATELRALDTAARARTDAVRAANPPAAPGQC